MANENDIAMQKKVDRLEGEIVEKDAEIARLEKEIEKRVEQINKLERRIEDIFVPKNIVDLEKEIEQKDKEIARLTQKNKELYMALTQADFSAKIVIEQQGEIDCSMKRSEMNMYKENPKTAGSGVICAIPQRGECPMRCMDCFFQAGRSYLEPLAENLPNMPSESKATNRVVRVNDGNDSNVDRDLVLKATAHYRHKFYNTSIPKPFDEPFVLTVNPGKMTDASFHHLEPIPASLMFVRFRANTWNAGLAKEVVVYYTSRNVPVVLTFMAYFQHEGTVPAGHATNYTKRKRTMNEYLAITTAAWRTVMREFEDNSMVYSCGKIEGEKGKSGCKYCGNCIREYYATMERLRG